MLNYKIYTRSILNAIKKIEKTCRAEESLNNEDILDMTLMRLQVIGENSIKLPLEIKRKHKEIKWKNIRSLRNLISHKYDTIDKEILWKFINEKIPELKKALLEIEKETNEQ